MSRGRVLGLCLLLAGCDRLVVITAVDRPDLEESDADAQGDGDAAESDDAETNEGPGDASETIDAASDSGPPENTPIDASRADGGARDDAGDDAAISAQDAGPDAMLPACAGKRVLDLCWYLGAQGASCDQTCRDKGGFDARSIKRVGTSGQGGSLRACTQVLATLGYSGNVTPGYRDDGVGLGCHIWEERDLWWLDTMPDFNPAASISIATIACACLR